MADAGKASRAVGTRQRLGVRRCGSRGLRRIVRKPFAGASSISKKPSRSGSGRASSAAGTQFGALGLDRFPDFRALVLGEIVDQHDVSRRERWRKHFFDISEETFAIDRAIEDEGGGDAIMAKRGHESRRLPMPMRHFGIKPLAAPAPCWSLPMSRR